MPRAASKQSAAPLSLTLEEARGVALAAQGLDPLGAVDARPGPATTADNIAAMIERLGIVQIDTISVVA
ncbi:MAG: hypothetical protein KGO05_06260, partial [Chloroflexota bacterium]|nr:hypothetical protein [Chloroflexota bacterium]